MVARYLVLYISCIFGLCIFFRIKFLLIKKNSICSVRLCYSVIHQLYLIKSVFPMTLQAESTSATNESVLKVALDYGKTAGVIKSHDRVVVCQKVGDASVVKIIELED